MTDLFHKTPCGHGDRPSRADINRFQDECLNLQLDRLFDDATRPFFRDRLLAAGVHRDDIRTTDDLANVPVTTKADLRDNEAANPPYGTYHSRDLSRYVRVQATSGTTGVPTHIFWTQQDLEIERATAARQLRRAGMVENDIVSHSYPFGSLVSGEVSVNVTQAVEELGALCIPVGAPADLAEARAQLELWQRMGVTYALFWGPLLAMYEEAAAGSIELSSLPVERLLVADPAVQFNDSRAPIEDQWGAQVFTLYGAKEFQAFLGTDCSHHNGLHVAEDRAVVEILDDDDRRLPIGERGRIVMTSLYRDTALLRYETGDLGRLVEGCPCGDSTLKVIYEGRGDELVRDASGHAFFPLDVQRVLARVVRSGGADHMPEFLITADASGRAQRIDVENGFHGTTKAAELGASLEDEFGITGVEVALVDEGGLPRSNFKMMRVVRV
jgi:phenylacetate-CoA ligase